MRDGAYVRRRERAVDEQRLPSTHLPQRVCGGETGASRRQLGRPRLPPLSHRPAARLDFGFAENLGDVAQRRWIRQSRKEHFRDVVGEDRVRLACVADFELRQRLPDRHQHDPETGERRRVLGQRAKRRVPGLVDDDEDGWVERPARPGDVEVDLFDELVEQTTERRREPALVLDGRAQVRRVGA